MAMPREHWNLRPCTTKFGLWMRNERQKRRWTQKELSLRVGIAQTYLNRYERGRYHPDEIAARKISEVFNIPFNEVWQIREESFDYRQEMGIEGMHRIEKSQSMRRVRDAHIEPSNLMNMVPQARHDEATIEYKVRIRLDVLKDVIEEAEKYNITAPQMIAIGIQNYFSEQKRLGSFAPVEDLVEEEKARTSKVKRKSSRFATIAKREKREKAQEVKL